MEYKAIPGFPGYKVSKSGKVKGPDGNMLSPRKDKDDYLRVDVRNGGKRFTRFVHDLVNRTWNGDKGPEVDHKNKNRQDNSADNLESVDRKENVRRIHRKK